MHESVPSACAVWVAAILEENFKDAGMATGRQDDWVLFVFVLHCNEGANCVVVDCCVETFVFFEE